MIRPKNLGPEPKLSWLEADTAAEAGDLSLIDAYNKEAKKLAGAGKCGHTRVYPGLSLEESTKRLNTL